MRKMSNSWICETCGNRELVDGNNGFFYCSQCSSQAQDYKDTGVADEDFYDETGDAQGGLYSARNTRRVNISAVKPELLSQPLDNNPLSQTNMENDNAAADAVGPTEPEDFGFDTVEGYYSEVRLRYVKGVQRMIELQCEALVREFKVNPLICGLSGSIWLRFLAWTRVFQDDWGDRTFDDAEIRQQGEPPEDFKPRSKYRDEPHTREAVLPTDIVKWSVEGKLPYFSAFLEIEKELGRPSRACPISSSLMFRPSESVPVQKLEALAASIAESVGLHLPPVNFFAIASRYLKKLSLPVGKVLPHARRIYEWSMPPDLWLSTNELRLPTRVFVMSILIVAVRVLYNIHGFGEWEKSLSRIHTLSSTSNQMGDVDPTSNSKMRSGTAEDLGSPSHNLDDTDTELVRNLSNAQNSELDAAELLSSLEAKHNEIADTYEYCKDLPTYLQFCKDVVFAGSKSSFKDHKEEELIELLWNFYQSRKDSETAIEQGLLCGETVNQKRLRDSNDISKEKKFSNKCPVSSPYSGDETPFADDQQRSKNGDNSCSSSQNSQNSEVNDAETLKEEAIARMKLDMEEKRFFYIPPRVNLKRFDYLHYVRKKDEGAYTYVAHADYYILLRACARVAEVEIRCMHIAVLSFERRLAWMEERINHCLHLTPPIVSCEYCTGVVPENTNTENDIESIGFPDLNL
ncbi:maternal effect embryo arrest 12 [Prunus dulcis]|uniref:Maternal effect embryo arrest 12 n=1 Tax=Prunus dulcis TaxID=3755 RepID=A0A4Y1RH59_PRUDU|nr:maternal effect embryo arrest 12 [Prunus dulcis]